MNIVIVNSSDTFEYRADMVYAYFSKRNHTVTVLSSDFMHIEKKRRQCTKKDYIYLRTIPYKKNISLRRLYSHYRFSRKCIRWLQKKQFDLLYIVIPPNCQSAIAKKYAKCNKVKIVMDIIDMWPESFPSKNTDHFPFRQWGKLRDRNLKYADYIITECDLYQEKLKKFLSGIKVQTIYWSHQDNALPGKAAVATPMTADEIHLCYLGSINHIIDISKIGEIISSIANEKKVVLKIIGGGERKELLISTAEENGATVYDYGKVYDHKTKKEIMDTCHYGLNIMKDTICVGLSMKSVDYLENGLPVINNLPGDMAQIVYKERCGVNISDSDWLDQVLVKSVNSDIRVNALECYRKYFSKDMFETQLKKVVDEVIADSQRW